MQIADIVPPGIASLGEVMQLAFVPADLEASVRFWTGTMGAGPFFHIPHVERHLTGMRYRGAPADIHFSVTVGYWGALQIEMITQHNDAPSIFREWRGAGQEGLHHVCLIVPDMQHARRMVSAKGGTIVQEMFLPDGEAIYADTGGGPGTLVEMYQAPPDRIERYATIREAARNWDGKNPFRLLGAAS